MSDQLWTATETLGRITYTLTQDPDPGYTPITEKLDAGYALYARGEYPRDVRLAWFRWADDAAHYCRSQMLYALADALARHLDRSPTAARP